VFLASLKAAGLGTNLTAGSHVHMMDPWWNPAVEDQAMVRECPYPLLKTQHDMVSHLCGSLVFQRLSRLVFI
jgi:hypothetical protein